MSMEVTQLTFILISLNKYRFKVNCWKQTSHHISYSKNYGSNGIDIITSFRLRWDNIFYLITGGSTLIKKTELKRLSQIINTVRKYYYCKKGFFCLFIELFFLNLSTKRGRDSWITRVNIHMSFMDCKAGKTGFCTFRFWFCKERE